ncbi:sugar phosphate isomerase/epimerase [Streptomyces sp. NBC_01267]|uniref:sugar phosphate isomerase/epimerase family protein n=1 Tax=unclassified Streptomyces TaxID=2593676 RepID=UPI002DDC11F9|nr:MULTISPECIES: sugar phosphate isomerase/epimerase [unclassified Streptomyces]WSC18797.1 sugar phosphate isomerase/epimerase [Streptomyces sp. NBC_01766]WSV52832.1 sugar phosphate isomerase/epimerase [Streptomyces sp. NBC_01014]
MSRHSAATDPDLVHRLSRRNMLGVTAGAGAAALLGLSATPAAAGAKGHQQGQLHGDHPGHGDTHGRTGPVLTPGRLGIQLYSLRDKIAEIGFAKVFDELERFGYDEIEYAGYTQGTGAITPSQLHRIARDHGLNGIGSHVNYYDDNNPGAYSFAQNLDKVLDDAQTLGLKHIGTASGPFRYGSTVDAWKRAAADFNTYGAAARKRGMKFYQHNHGDEFSFATDQPDVRLYDVLLAETDPHLVYLEMDIYWAFTGQFRFSRTAEGKPAPFEPLDYVLKQPDRYPLFHVKDGVHDEAARDGYDMTDVGDGDIDYKTFISAVNRTHGGRRSHHWQVEHDQPVDSFAFARKSAAHLHGLREEAHRGRN